VIENATLNSSRDDNELIITRPTKRIVECNPPDEWRSVISFTGSDAATVPSALHGTEIRTKYGYTFCDRSLFTILSDHGALDQAKAMSKRDRILFPEQQIMEAAFGNIRVRGRDMDVGNRQPH
jgi:hypothetical protein